MSSEDKRHNGWRNYETWLVKLWMDNDERAHGHFRDMAEGAWDVAEADSIFTRYEDAVCKLADRMKCEHEDSLDDLDPKNGFWVDLLRAALSEVDWREIAENLLECHQDVAPTA